MRISDWSSDVCSSDLFAAGSLDLVLSVLSLHWVNDLPGTLLQIGRALKPDGLLLAAMIGGDSLRELRDALLRAELEVEDGVSPDRKSTVWGKGGSVRLDLGGRRLIKKKNTTTKPNNTHT